MRLDQEAHNWRQVAARFRVDQHIEALGKDAVVVIGVNGFHRSLSGRIILEDFVQHQERELERLEEYLGLKLARIPAKRDAIGRDKEYPGLPFPEFLKPAMREHGNEF
jgi:hypothetical protein